MAAPPPVARRNGHGAPKTLASPLSPATWLGVAWLVALLLAVVFGTTAAALALPHPLAVAWLALEAALLAVPLGTPPPAWATRFLHFSVRCPTGGWGGCGAAGLVAVGWSCHAPPDTCRCPL